MSRYLQHLLDKFPIRRSEEKTLIKGASSAFIIKVIGAALAFGVQIILARSLGVSNYGAYIYIYSWLTVLVIPVRLGFDNSLIRFIPEYHSSKRWGDLKGILVFSFCCVGIFSILTTIFILILLSVWSGLLPTYDRELIIVAAICLPFLGLLHIAKSVLKGLKKVILSQIPEMLIKQTVIGVGTILVYFILDRSINSIHVMWVTLITIFISLIVALLFLKKVIPRQVSKAQLTKKYKFWFGVTFPMLLITGINIVLKKTDVIMIGSFLGKEAAGIYGATVKVSDLSLFGLQAVNTIAAPLISQYYYSNNINMLQHIITLATRGAFFVSLFISVFFIVIGEFVLDIFGKGFPAGYWALSILLTSQIINAFSGSVGFLMTMTGHQKQAAQILAASAVINLVLNLIFIPYLGIEGGAIATGFSVIFWNISMVFYVKKNLKIDSTAVSIRLTRQNR